MGNGYSKEAYKLMQDRDISYAFACEILENEAKKEKELEIKSEEKDEHKA